MLIIGAKGFAKEVLEVCHQNKQLKNIAFYDDCNEDVTGLLFSKFPIVKTLEQVKKYFSKYGPFFALGIGNPIIRKKLYDKFTSMGGTCVSIISPCANIGSYDVEIGEGANILGNATISNNVRIGKAPLIYYHSIVSHDVVMSDFVEVSPGATILGNVTVGKFTKIGSNATILPFIKVGNNITIGAGAVVTKDLPDNCVAVGVPAKVIKIKDIKAE